MRLKEVEMRQLTPDQAALARAGARPRGIRGLAARDDPAGRGRSTAGCARGSGARWTRSSLRCSPRRRRSAARARSRIISPRSPGSIRTSSASPSRMRKDRVHGAGDCDEPFSIQSISKVFMLALALEKVGADLWKRVGREPSGSPFNSIVQLEHEQGIPRNPLINPGALAVTDTLDRRWQRRGGDRDIARPAAGPGARRRASASTRRWRSRRATPARATAASPGS